MFKVEIDSPNGFISKVCQNDLNQDWPRFLLTKHSVTKDKIKIYWIKGMLKNDYVRDCFNLKEKGKFQKGKKLHEKLIGDRVHKDRYESFVKTLGGAGLLDTKEFTSPKKVKKNPKKETLYEVKDLSPYNKDWFIKEKEYELIELRWPYDEHMKFIGFNFDPGA
jgi:hypothetical protein